MHGIASHRLIDQFRRLRTRNDVEQSATAIPLPNVRGGISFPLPSFLESLSCVSHESRASSLSEACMRSSKDWPDSAIRRMPALSCREPELRGSLQESWTCVGNRKQTAIAH